MAARLADQIRNGATEVTIGSGPLPLETERELLDVAVALRSNECKVKILTYYGRTTGLTDRAAQEIGESLTINASIEKISFRRFRGATGSSRLALFFQRGFQVQEVEFVECGFEVGAAAIQAISQTVYQGGRRKLTFRGCSWSDVRRILNPPTTIASWTLKSLVLDHIFYLVVDTLGELSESLQSLGVEELCITRSYFHEETTVTALTTLLRQNQQLKSVQLYYCSIDSAGAIVLGRVFSETTCGIRTCDLRRNPIQREGYKALLPSMYKNVTITEFLLGGHYDDVYSPSEEQALSFRQICRANSILADGTSVVEGDERCWDLVSELAKHPAALFAMIRESPSVLRQLQYLPAAAVNGKRKRDE